MDTKHYIENTNLTLQNIANKQGISLKAVRKVWASYTKEFKTSRKANTYRASKLGDLNPMQGKCREEHHNYIGVVSDNKGYLLVLKPAWYTGRKRSNHIFQHHLVVCLAMGLTQVKKGFCVHHCDENTQNNDFDNLVLMTMNEHSSLHSSLEGATTISKESTLKWVEARRTGKPVVI